MTPRPRVVSWFAGIGGFDLAFARAGAEVVGACEIDRSARRIYGARFGAPAWFPTDINDVRPADVPEAEVWCGGSPCQGFSVAGKRGGLGDDRSGLARAWFDLVAAVRPRWLVVENVPGLLSLRADFGELIARLDDLGYVGAWRVLDAQNFGVAQRRRRVFVVARLGGGADPREVLFEREGVRGDFAAGGEARAIAAGHAGGSARVVDAFGEHGVAATLNAHGGRMDAESESFVVGALRHLGGGGPDDNEAQAGHLVASSLRASYSKRGERGDGADNLIAFSSKDAGGDAGLLAPTLRGGVHRASHANGGAPPAIAGALLSSYGSGSEQHPERVGRDAQLIPGVGVRRLTPTECERLQGFPGGWTCTCAVAPYSTAACRCPDGPRYRALGNAVAVPVVEWIARRLVTQ